MVNIDKYNFEIDDHIEKIGIIMDYKNKKGLLLWILEKEEELMSYDIKRLKTILKRKSIFVQI